MVPVTGNVQATKRQTGSRSVIAQSCVGTGISCEGAQGIFWSDENILKVGYGDGCTTWYIY